VRANAQDEEVL
jgi:hypothetical protein